MRNDFKVKLGVVLLIIGLLTNPIFGFTQNNRIKNGNLELSKLPVRPLIAEEKTKEVYDKLPMSFEINQGQVDDDIKFLSRCTNYTLFLTGNEAVFSLEKNKEELYAIKMQLLGSKSAEITGEEELPSKSNYFIGNDQKKWKTDVSHYAKVRYKEIYNGIDLIYYRNQNQLEYDFVIKPGAKTEDIQMNYTGIDKVFVSKEGDLILKICNQEIKQHKPYIYQEKNGQRIEVEGNYKLGGKDKNRVGFNIREYDTSRLLIIDPVLSYSTYLGGIETKDEENGYAIAVDRVGAAYVTGSTNATDFPTQPNSTYIGSCKDVFVTKLNSDGSMAWSTYIGGSKCQEGYGVTVDSIGSVYVTGETNSSDFPTSKQYKDFQGEVDAFVTKLNSTGGKLLYSTYLGGNNSDYGKGIAVDSTGSAYVTGLTASPDFPIEKEYQGFQGWSDAFVTKLNPEPLLPGQKVSLAYSTCLGGRDSDWGSGLAIDNAGAVYVIGYTESSNFPTQIQYMDYQRNGDAFVTKLNPEPAEGLHITLAYSTYLGGSGHDEGHGIAIDNTKAAYVTGFTVSTNFPTQNQFQDFQGGSDVFVTKINPERVSDTSITLGYSTYLGGSDSDRVLAIAVNATGTAYITGLTFSTNFPLQNNYQDYQGNGDIFITKLNPLTGSNVTLGYSIYLGGKDAEWSSSIAVDSMGAVYITGWTWSPDFPTKNPLQSNLNGKTDAFVTKIDDRCPDITVSPSSLSNGKTCTPYLFLDKKGILSPLKLNTTGGLAPYLFSVSTGLGTNNLPSGLKLFPNGTIVGTPIKSGIYNFAVEVKDAWGCRQTKNYTITVEPGVGVSPSTLPVGNVGITYSQTITASGGTAPYKFEGRGPLPVGITLDTRTGVLSGTPAAIGTSKFEVIVTDANGCKVAQSYTLQINCPIIALAPAILPKGKIGNSYSQVIIATGGIGPYIFNITTGRLPDGINLLSNGTLAGIPGPITTPGTYNFTIEVIDAFSCRVVQAFTLEII